MRINTIHTCEEPSPHPTRPYPRVHIYFEHRYTCYKMHTCFHVDRIKPMGDSEIAYITLLFFFITSMSLYQPLVSLLSSPPTTRLLPDVLPLVLPPPHPFDPPPPFLIGGAVWLFQSVITCRALNVVYLPAQIDSNYRALLKLCLILFKIIIII